MSYGYDDYSEWFELKDINYHNNQKDSTYLDDRCDNKHYPGLEDQYNNINNNINNNLSGNSNRISFIAIVIAIIISWILVAFWTRALENLFYVKLGFDGESFWQTLLVALMLSIFFFALVWFLESLDSIKTPTSQVQGRLVDYGALIIPNDFNSENFIVPPF